MAAFSHCGAVVAPQIQATETEIPVACNRATPLVGQVFGVAKAAAQYPGVAPASIGRHQPHAAPDLSSCSAGSASTPTMSPYSA